MPCKATCEPLPYAGDNTPREVWNDLIEMLMQCPRLRPMDLRTMYRRLTIGRLRRRAAETLSGFE
ncbi:hypothetical protein TWF481_002077 [Arthrobotrys musiformis]|uniref:Uncharacterized protein n=1 Tax=Arthrobotrys musiformis TaxID=47236 RepID=A0AAV9VTE3_9PEZI